VTPALDSNPVLLSWSSGKDSAWALHEMRLRGDALAGLLTTVTREYRRVSMHGVPLDILECQAQRAGLPRVTVEIPAECPNADYERAFSEAAVRAAAQGIASIAFGDLFLEDVRAYRERLLAPTGVAPRFPLWGRDTRELAHEMIDGGLQAILVCIDAARLPPEFAGRTYDRELLRDLPAGVDPCGENGEFHTCVTAGPMFSAPIPVVVRTRVVRGGFVYADLALGESPPA
jgi:uncharacterized protein (TIGR00290 family)